MRSIAIALLLAVASPALAGEATIAQQSVDNADAWLDIVRDRVASLKAERKVAVQAERTAQRLLQTALITDDAIAIEAANTRLAAAIDRTARLDADLTEALAERDWAADQLASARTQMKATRG